jgi:hypothetical protein
MVHGGTCPLEDVAVGARQDGEWKSHGSFHGDDSWKCCKRFRYAEPVSDRANDWGCISKSLVLDGRGRPEKDGQM